MADPLLAAAGVGLLVAVACLVARAVWGWARGRLGLAVGHYREAREAERRADQLLREVLMPEEYASLAERGYLDVRSQSRPTRVYRIPRDGGLVILRERCRVIGGLCAQPTTSIPAADVVAMHKLMIEGAEAEYLRTANHLSVGALYRYGLDVLCDR